MDEADFSSSDDIVARADSFMHRQRPRPGGPTPTPEDLDDLPLLTDIVDPQALPAMGQPAPEHQAPAEPERLREQLREQICQAVTERLSARLSAEIPTLVEAAIQAALPAIAWEIQQSLLETTRAVLNEPPPPGE